MKHLMILLATLTVSLNSYGYLSLMTTGDVTPQNNFRLLGYLEAAFDTYDGVNVNARGIYGLAEDLEVDIEVGVGEFDVMLGAFLKWVPIPDYDNQPAVGVRAGLSYIDTDKTSQTSVVAMPFVSKAINTDHGRITPYGGVPFGINSNSRDTDFTARLALGAEYIHPDYQTMRIYGEVDFELSKSFNSINAGAAFDF